MCHRLRGVELSFVVCFFAKIIVFVYTKIKLHYYFFRKKKNQKAKNYQKLLKKNIFKAFVTIDAAVPYKNYDKPNIKKF